MRRFFTLGFSVVLLAASLTALPNSASAATIITTCTDLTQTKTTVLKTDKKSCRPMQAVAIWQIEKSDSKVDPLESAKALRVCSSANPLFSYQLIKSRCPKFQITTDYRRVVAKLLTPLITSASENGYNAATLLIAPDTSSVRSSAPILYYLVTNLKTHEITHATPDQLNRISISDLNSLTSYTFQITAVNVDGTSPISLVTREIRTTAVPVPEPAPVVTPAPVLAVPAFTLSAIAETKTVSVAIAGYAITSVGGTIASYSISPSAPAGLSFSASTGLLSGTPTSTAGATTYTITATNASGSATRIFTLTVTAVVYSVGDRGPGGGIVYYVSADYFTSTGSTCNTNCKYLEVAPSGWNNGDVFRSDPLIQWSTDSTTLTGQERTPANQSNFLGEKVNWAIGKGFSNTSLIRPTSAIATSTLSYGATDGSTGQWFIPSMNELNELCKYSRGQTTGVVTVACNSSGALRTGTSDAYGGFVDSWYWSSSEEDVNYVYGLWKVVIDHDTKDDRSFFRPIRAI